MEFKIFIYCLIGLLFCLAASIPIYLFRIKKKFIFKAITYIIAVFPYMYDYTKMIQLIIPTIMTIYLGILLYRSNRRKNRLIKLGSSNKNNG